MDDTPEEQVERSRRLARIRKRRQRTKEREDKRQKILEVEGEAEGTLSAKRKATTDGRSAELPLRRSRRLESVRQSAMARLDRETNDHRFVVESDEQKTSILLCSAMHSNARLAILFNFFTPSERRQPLHVALHICHAYSLFLIARRVLCACVYLVQS